MANKQIILTHIFEATPEQLWDSWTVPEQFSRWFNPAEGYDLIIKEFDVRVGGRMSFDMPQPNGDLNHQEGVFHVLDPFKEIVSGSPDKSFLIKANFIEMGKKTKIVVEITGVPPEYHAGAVKGWNSGFSKLETLLANKIFQF